MLCALRVGELFIVLCRSLARTVRMGVGFVCVEFVLCRCGAFFGPIVKVCSLFAKCHRFICMVLLVYSHAMG